MSRARVEARFASRVGFRASGSGRAALVAALLCAATPACASAPGPGESGEAGGSSSPSGPAAGTGGSIGAGEGATTSSTGSGGATSGSGGATGSGGGAAPMHGDPASSVPGFAALLDEIEGWGTGTTGGIDGTVFVVDTLADDGPRSLRTALTSPDAFWIVFDAGLDGTIQLASTIEPTSNKTVDARGHHIQIRSMPGNPFTAFQIVGQSNLAFVNLILDDELQNWDQDSEGADGITIHDSDHIWVHHCSFARWLDGAIDIRHDAGTLSNHISVTWSSFSKVYQALNWTADLISFGHNHCDQVRRRCIQMIDGKGHSYNNVVADWNNPAIQNSKDAAVLYSLRNMFVPGAEPGVDSRVNGGKIANQANHSYGSVQFLGGSDAIDQTFVADSEALAKIESCGAQDGACWDQLRAAVETSAGAQ